MTGFYFIRSLMYCKQFTQFCPDFLIAVQAHELFPCLLRVIDIFKVDCLNSDLICVKDSDLSRREYTRYLFQPRALASHELFPWYRCRAIF